MGKTQYKKNNRKRVAHTTMDMRYKLQNKVKMNACMFCSQYSLQVKPNKKITNGTWIWTECTSCGLSGADEMIKVNHLTEWQDVLSTLVDANDY